MKFRQVGCFAYAYHLGRGGRRATCTIEVQGVNFGIDRDFFTQIQCTMLSEGDVIKIQLRVITCQNQNSSTQGRRIGVVDDFFAIQVEEDVTVLIREIPLIPYTVFQCDIALVEQIRTNTILVSAKQNVVTNGIVLHKVLGVGVHTAETNTHIAVYCRENILDTSVETKIERTNVFIQSKFEGTTGTALIGNVRVTCLCLEIQT